MSERCAFWKFWWSGVIIKRKVEGEPTNTWTMDVFSGRLIIENSSSKCKLKIWNWFPSNDFCLCTKEESLGVTSESEYHSFWTYFRVRIVGVLFNGHTSSRLQDLRWDPGVPGLHTFPSSSLLEQLVFFFFFLIKCSIIISLYSSSSFSQD